MNLFYSTHAAIFKLDFYSVWMRRGICKYPFDNTSGYLTAFLILLQDYSNGKSDFDVLS